VLLLEQDVGSTALDGLYNVDVGTWRAAATRRRVRLHAEPSGGTERPEASSSKGAFCEGLVEGGVFDPNELHLASAQTKILYALTYRQARKGCARHVTIASPCRLSL
jgi:hypothetical protein